MVVKCDKCGSDDVVLMTRIDVAFKFDENGDVKLIADLADDIYWRVEYEGLKAICYCHSCGRCFKYKGEVDDENQVSELRQHQHHLRS